MHDFIDYIYTNNGNGIDVARREDVIDELDKVFDHYSSDKIYDAIVDDGNDERKIFKMDARNYLYENEDPDVDTQTEILDKIKEIQKVIKSEKANKMLEDLYSKIQDIYIL